MKTLVTQLKKETADICYQDGRMVDSPGHEKARLHLIKRLAEIGCVPYIGRSVELFYTYKNIKFCNLVGRIPGSDSKLAPILIGAHYDSVIPHPCADDNAAAVAIALQAGRILAEKKNNGRDILIAIFDAEEPPYFLGDGIHLSRTAAKAASPWPRAGHMPGASSLRPPKAHRNKPGGCFCRSSTSTASKNNSAKPKRGRNKGRPCEPARAA